MFLLPICLLCACKGRERVFPFFLRLAALCMILLRRFKILLGRWISGKKTRFESPKTRFFGISVEWSWLALRPQKSLRYLWGEIFFPFCFSRHVKATWCQTNGATWSLWHVTTPRMENQSGCRYVENDSPHHRNSGKLEMEMKCPLDSTCRKNVWHF